MPRTITLCWWTIVCLLAGFGCSERQESPPTHSNTAAFDNAPLKELFYQYCATANNEERATLRATFQASRNSIPFLVGAVFRLEELDQWLMNHHPPLDIGVTNIANETDGLIADLHPSAPVLVPLLTNVLSDFNHPHYYRAIYLLGRVGEGSQQVLPYLEEALTNSSPEYVDVSTHSLWLLGSNAAPALPAILFALQRPENERPSRLYRILPRLGLAAAPAIPVLEQQWISTDRTNPSLIRLICEIDTNQAPRFVRELTHIWSNTGRTNKYVAKAICLADTNQTPRIVEQMVTMTTSAKRDGSVPAAIATLLWISKPDGIAVLRKKMHTKQPNVALWAAGCLLRQVPDDLEASLFLQYFLINPRHQRSWDSYALQQLAFASSTNQDVIKLVARYMQDPRDDVRNAAEQSLAEIRGR